MNTHNVQNQKGFTLVEIAIVLVIIGLLLGGVLKGQELITNSKIKSVTQDLEGIAAAYYAYQDRTGTIAGDTDNDGQINTDANFWQDLRTEGFIAGLSSATSGPRHDLDGVFSAHVPASAFFGTKNYICASNVEESVAQGIDTNLDDSAPNTGDIRVGSDATTLITSYAASDTARFICKEL